MANNVVGLLLFEQAWSTLGDAILPYSSAGKIGRYIYCANFRNDGAFVTFTGSCKNQDGSTFIADISIPSSFVLMVASATDESGIGFIGIP